MTHIMIDLETMGTSKNAAIVSIGAVVMDFENNLLDTSFYHRICLESAVAAGGVIDAATVKWWLQQSDVARREIYSASANLTKVLSYFSAFIAANCEHRQVKVWGNGAAFDNVILRSTYEACGIEPPWKYWNDRCYRTMKNMFKTTHKEPSNGVVHNALDDATNQALNLLDIVSKHNLQGALATVLGGSETGEVEAQIVG